jgi:hypothetical protein
LNAESRIGEVQYETGDASGLSASRIDMGVNTR